MASFRGNLRDLKKWLPANAAEIVRDSMDIERVLAERMYSVIIDRVYESYEPTQYERRGNDGGLSDVRNMVISDVFVDGNNQIKILFENIAQGSDSLNDGMLVDAFESGGEKHWDKQGVWSTGRSFIQETAEAIRQNPEGVVEALKREFRSNGFKVR